MEEEVEEESEDGEKSYETAPSEYDMNVAIINTPQ